MALSSTTQFANRYGLDVRVFAIGANVANAAEALINIDFVNSCALEVTGERSWATGGQAKVNKIAFNNPLSGTFTMSTQILTDQLLNLMSGANVADANVASSDTVVFENDAFQAPAYYQISANTVWQDANGATYAETVVCHKATPQRAFNITYEGGDGDPSSMDIVFDLMEDANHKIVTLTKVDS